MCQVVCEVLEMSPEHTRVPALMGGTSCQEETGGKGQSPHMCARSLDQDCKESKAK